MVRVCEKQAESYPPDRMTAEGIAHAVCAQDGSGGVGWGKGECEVDSGGAGWGED